MDVVMNGNIKQGRDGRRNEDDDEMNVWFSKVNVFLSHLHSEDSAENDATNFWEHTFLKYLKIAGIEDVSINAAGRAPAYIQFAWTGGDFDEKITPGKYIGLCSLCLRRGTGHMVVSPEELHKLNRHLKRKLEIETLYRKASLNAQEWFNELFYVNEFYISRKDRYHFRDSILRVDDENFDEGNSTPHWSVT